MQTHADEPIHPIADSFNEDAKPSFGLTKREWFAGQIASGTEPEGVFYPDDIVYRSDALIEALNKSTQISVPDGINTPEEMLTWGAGKIVGGSSPHTVSAVEIGLLSPELRFIRDVPDEDEPLPEILDLAMRYQEIDDRVGFLMQLSVFLKEKISEYLKEIPTTPAQEG